MIVYVAAPYQMKPQAATVAAVLRGKGHKVSSTWHDREDENDEATARRDLEEVEACEAFLLINPEEWDRSGTGGRHVEFGYALARSKDMIIFGVRSNLFHQFEAIRFIGSLEEL